MVPSHPSYVKWIAPEEGHFKINFDGVKFEVSNMTGIGVVIHNHKGLVIAVLTQKIYLTMWMLWKLLWRSRAILFYREIGLSKVLFEGDSSLFQHCRKDRLCLHSLGRLLMMPWF